MGPVEYLFVVAAAVGVSCLVAWFASGGRASAAWGIFGPIGWIVAAGRGTHERLEDLTAALTRSARAPGEMPGTVACPRCRTRTSISPRGESVTCQGCALRFTPDAAGPGPDADPASR